jgi:hypothetical protein
MMSKQDVVLSQLKIKPMTVHELTEMFWPNITYSYIRTMMHRLYKEGILEVAEVEKMELHQGGSREVYRYMVSEKPPLDGNSEEDDILPVRRKVIAKGRDAVPNLTHANLKIEKRKELVMKHNPLFVMYFGKEYL